ncbi:TPA: hypothetical protein ACG3PC_002747 [Clostridioides difficile]|uniref:hypothetical protein n=1 Tax=Clostridioides difficile TaxID=1496 RepID=UPI001C150C0E|nr:hypothetical protein [Clostridioides difficile]MCO4408262.1 hypothetical protein [Clostridioides difficile]MDN3912116.1 hypothetical protein [Clostridioides difficile]HBG0817772.1 hypothetical protein [Clostridioides difficile]HBH1635287.1 hypothetical protein [Clostridioides difficile]
MRPVTKSSNNWNKKESWINFETPVNNFGSSGFDRLYFVSTREDSFICVRLDKIDITHYDCILKGFEDIYKEIS